MISKEDRHIKILTDRHKNMDRQTETKVWTDRWKKINGKTDTQKIWTATGAEKTWTERQQDKGCGQ